MGILLAALGTGLSGCSLARLRGQSAAPSPSDTSSTSARHDEPSSEKVLEKGDEKSEIIELRKQVAAMHDRVQVLETRLIEAKASAPAKGGLESVSVTPHPAEGGAEVNAKVPPARDPEAGFVNDAAVGAFRQALLLLEAGQFADSALAFAAFLEKYPDHPLAGSAQFHLGECQSKLGNHEQALKEFQKVLTSYDRSGHVPDALKAIAGEEDKLGQSDKAARHRQLLLSLFPASPAARPLSAEERLRDGSEAGESGTKSDEEEAPAPRRAPEKSSEIHPNGERAEKLPTPVKGSSAEADPVPSASSGEKSPPAREPATAAPQLDAPPPTAPISHGEAGR